MDPWCAPPIASRWVNLAQRFLRNYADAEEIAQDTFIRAHCGLARFRSHALLAAWLHRITFNLTRNRYWYFYRRRHLALSPDSLLNAEMRTKIHPQHITLMKLGIILSLILAWADVRPLFAARLRQRSALVS